jgi:glucosamine-6-phosphate deaminase
MQRHLFDRVNLPPGRIHFLNGTARNSAEECDRYERAIARAGGIDLQILGLGGNGHIGFNEPAATLRARTHRTRLSLATRRANKSLFGNRLVAVPAKRCRWEWRPFFAPDISCCWSRDARRPGRSSA